MTWVRRRTRFLRFRYGHESLLDYAIEMERVIRMLEDRLRIVEAQLRRALAAQPKPPSAEAAARGRSKRWASKTGEERRAHSQLMLAARRARKAARA